MIRKEVFQRGNTNKVVENIRSIVGFIISNVYFSFDNNNST